MQVFSYLTPDSIEQRIAEILWEKRQLFDDILSKASLSPVCGGLTCGHCCGSLRASPITARRKPDRIEFAAKLTRAAWEVAQRCGRQGSEPEMEGDLVGSARPSFSRGRSSPSVTLLRQRSAGRRYPRATSVDLCLVWRMMSARPAPSSSAAVASPARSEWPKSTGARRASGGLGRGLDEPRRPPYRVGRPI